MTNYTARAAEAIEHQARYWRMLENPAYRDWIGAAITGTHKLSGIQVSGNNLLDDMTARTATAAGEPFWWSPQICQLLEATSPSMPAYTLARENLPAPGGFFWFDRPIDVGNKTHVKAIAWAQMIPNRDVDPLPDGGFRPKHVSARANTLQDAAAIRAVFFETTGELRRVSKDPLHQTWELPMASVVWKFGSNYQDQQTRDIMTGGPPQGEYDGTAESRLFASCIAFLNQRVLVSPRVEAPQRVKERLARAKTPHEPFARLVALRRAFERLSGASEAKGDPVAWTCSWLVGARTGGFWRQQWMPSTGTHEPRFIAPYAVDTGMPFKPVSRVAYSVHR